MYIFDVVMCMTHIISDFRGGRASHGNSRNHRTLGSTGQCQDPGRVWKGKKMPGRMGGKNKTTQNLKVVKVSVCLCNSLLPTSSLPLLIMYARLTPLVTCCMYAVRSLVTTGLLFASLTQSRAHSSPLRHPSPRHKAHNMTS
jgi:hypothetical protein